jgi:hypothetical protein
MAAEGMLLIAPAMHTQALESFVTACLWFTFGHQISERYVITSLTTVVYSHCTICGFSPHVFPNVLCPTIKAILRLFVTFCKCWFHVSLLTRVKPRYLTSPAVFTCSLKKVGSHKPSRFLLLMKRKSAVLMWFTCSFSLKHDPSTVSRPLCMSSDTDWRVNCNISLASQPDLKTQMCLIVKGRDYGGESCLSETWGLTQSSGKILRGCIYNCTQRDF